MAALNTYSSISTLVNTVWADAMFVAREQGPMVGLVTTMGDIRGMAVRKNTKYGTATINQVDESDDLTSQALTPSTDQTLTPYEYGAQFFLTDQRLDSDIYNLRGDAATELGGAYGDKVDGYLSGLFSSLTGGTVGGTTTDFTWANFFGAITKARIAKIPRPWVMVLQPSQWHALATAVAPGVTVTNSPMIQDEVLRSFYVNTVAGIDVFVDGNIATAATVYGGLFHRSAIALDMRRAPRIEVERDASRRGYELNWSSVFAYGVWRPSRGICIDTAGTTPV